MTLDQFKIAVQFVTKGDASIPVKVRAAGRTIDGIPFDMSNGLVSFTRSGGSVGVALVESITSVVQD